MVFWLSTTGAPALVVNTKIEFGVHRTLFSCPASAGSLFESSASESWCHAPKGGAWRVSFFFSSFMILLLSFRGGPLGSIFHSLLFENNCNPQLKKFLTRLTFGTKAEEIQTVVQNLKTGFPAHLFVEIAETGQFRIDDFFTAGADHMGMRKRLIPVIAVTSVREPEFQYFVQFFEQDNCFINGCQTGGGKCSFDLVEHLGHAGVRLIAGQYFQNGQPLGSEAKSFAFQLGKHSFQTVVSSQ